MTVNKTEYWAEKNLSFLGYDTTALKAAIESGDQDAIDAAFEPLILDFQEKYNSGEMLTEHTWLYDDAGIPPGTPGPYSREALDTDGILGPKTWEILKSAVRKQQLLLYTEEHILHKDPEETMTEYGAKVDKLLLENPNLNDQLTAFCDGYAGDKTIALRDSLASTATPPRAPAVIDGNTDNGFGDDGLGNDRFDDGEATFLTDEFEEGEAPPPSLTPIAPIESLQEKLSQIGNVLTFDEASQANQLFLNCLEHNLHDDVMNVLERLDPTHPYTQLLFVDADDATQILQTDPTYTNRINALEDEIMRHNLEYSHRYNSTLDKDIKNDDISNIYNGIHADHNVVYG